MKGCQDSKVPTSRLSAEELDEAIHDAWIDLDRVVESGEVVVIHGSVDRLLTRWRLGRLNMELRIRGALSAVEDDEGVGRLPVQEVVYEDGAFRLEGAIPGRIIVASADHEAELQVDDHPMAVRRWFRWRPTATKP